MLVIGFSLMSPVCVLMVWCVSFTLLVCHLLCPEPPLGTTTVHYWYKGALFSVPDVCACVDVIISVSILH